MISFPSISIIIPTLNSDAVLEKCLISIRDQKYPKSKISLILVDGGSTDGTLALAKRYHCQVIKNKLKTAEAGKALGVRAAVSDLIALIDSDNILPNKHWLVDMIRPFTDSEIILSEPIRYTYRRSDPYLTRYFSLLGMNDPICLFTGNYDRFSYITNRWTDLKFPFENKKGYLKISLDHEPIPTIGANGTIIRKNSLKAALGRSKYLFDIDILIRIIHQNGLANIAKVNTGIVHTFVEADVLKFFRKQLRRINDMSFHRSQNNRDLDWESSFYYGIIKFILFCLLVLPIFYQMFLGFMRKRDIAWFFHPVACYSTLIIYIYGWLKGKIAPTESNRATWKQ